MIQALLAPALAATLAPLPADGYVASATVPGLHVEGEPFVVEVEIRARGENPVEVPSWLLTPAGWLVDSKPLTKRPTKDSFLLQPDQSVRTALDVAPLLRERFGGETRDFSVEFAESNEEPAEVVWLGRPEGEPAFMEMPEEQLGDYQVVLRTSGGTIWLDLWPDVAPNHVRNFLDLCASGFYEGSPFHRVIPGFMVQGGRSAGSAQAPRKLEAEFNSRRHVAGVLSAARLGNDINSATSEFFIVHETSPHLDGNYTAFGRVLWGMDAVESIVDAVSAHYELVEALEENRVRLDVRRPNVATALNAPNPPQTIERAIVVRASKTRPDGR